MGRFDSYFPLHKKIAIAYVSYYFCIFCLFVDGSACLNEYEMLSSVFFFFNCFHNSKTQLSFKMSINGKHQQVIVTCGEPFIVVFYCFLNYYLFIYQFLTIYDVPILHFMYKQASAVTRRHVPPFPLIFKKETTYYLT